LLRTLLPSGMYMCGA